MEPDWFGLSRLGIYGLIKLMKSNKHQINIDIDLWIATISLSWLFINSHILSSSMVVQVSWMTIICMMIIYSYKSLIQWFHKWLRIDLVEECIERLCWYRRMIWLWCKANTLNFASLKVQCLHVDQSAELVCNCWWWWRWTRGGWESWEAGGRKIRSWGGEWGWKYKSMWVERNLVIEIYSWDS